MTTPVTSERPNPTRQRSFSNVNPSTNSHLTTSTQPGANSWLNTLADGLSWIEVQGGNVVSQAAQAGLGETIRGGLQGVGGVVQGGLAKRPLLLNGVLGGVGTPPTSENGDAMSDHSVGDNTSSNHNNNNNLLGSPGSSTPMRRRPASFLGLMKPRPQTPPSNPTPSGPLGSPGQSPVQNWTPTTGNRLFRNTTSPAQSPSPSPGPQADHNDPATISTPPRPQTLSSSLSSPPSTSPSILGRPTVTRLGPPRPANVTRLRHVESAQQQARQSFQVENRSQSTFDLRSHPQQAQEQYQHGRTSSTSDLNLSNSGSSNDRGAGLRASASGRSLDRFVLDGGAVMSAGSNSSANPVPGASTSSGMGLGLGGGRRRASGLERRGSDTAPQTPPPGSRTGTPGAVTPTYTGHALTPPQTLRTRSYKPGYQPPGVRATRTGEFEEARKKIGEERSREEGRLTRRWAKLIDLHFNPMAGVDSALAGSSTSAGPSTPPLTGKSPSRPRLTPQISERFSALTNTLDQVTPRDVWRGFRSVTGVGLEQVELEKKREMERGLVVWEEDGEVRRCRICQSIFSLTNRKHHCRLCGRIVCSLPPTPGPILALAQPSTASGTATTKTGLPLGTRRETCSLLLVADYRTGKGHEVDEGFVGWMQMGSGAGVGEQGKTGASASASASTATARRPDEVQVKGVRTCRECWGVVSRKQKMADMRQVSRFSRLYGALKSLESEIVDGLPEYQDLIRDLNRDDKAGPGSGGIPPDLMTLHKHLVALFAEYDAFTKRIRSYPCLPSSAQERVQQAIARQAGLFMAREAGTLQLLPKLQAQRHKRATSSAAVSIESSIAPAPPVVDDTAMLLQPLLEQEAQLEVFIAEANAQRKLEDARTLLVSLEELRQEITRIAAGTGGP